MLDLALLTSPTGTRIDAPTSQAGKVTASWNLQGAERLSAELPITLVTALHLVDTPGTLHEQLNDGPVAIWEGRLENPTLTDGGSTLEALGYNRALADLPYTALWSDTLYERWRPTAAGELANYVPERYQFDTNGALQITPEKNNNYDFTHCAAFLYAIPSGTRQLVGASWSFALTAPVTWLARLVRRNAALTTGTVVWSLAATGAAQTGVINATFTADDILTFELFYNTGVTAAYGGETGDAFFRINELRVVTSITNRVNTTLGTAIAAGTRTVTPASMANIYVGQKLRITEATVDELVVVTAVTSTTFTAVFARAHLATDAVQAHVIYADEVVRDLISTVNATNSTQLSSGTGLVQSPGRDLPDVLFEDTYGADVLADLVQRGDTQTQPRRWVWSVEPGQILRYAPLADGGRTWYVDAADITIQLSRENLYNDAYAIYEDASGNTLRTAVNPSTTSVARYGLTRRKAVKGEGSNALQAAAARDTAITQGAFPPPRVQVSFTMVFDAAGGRWPLYVLRPGDTLVARNLPPTLSTTIDQIRSFVIARVEYRLDDDTITVEPMDPLPTLEAALSV